MTPMLLTIHRASQVLGIPESALRRSVRDGEIPVAVFGRTQYVPDWGLPELVRLKLKESREIRRCLAVMQ